MAVFLFGKPHGHRVSKESDAAEHSEGMRVVETGKGTRSRELKEERVAKKRSVSFMLWYQLNKGRHEVICRGACGDLWWEAFGLKNWEE